jgi:2-succinyl-5-enolpyruvyl-6-hydroxy-3-cyclohexene-1-carboxylate synthase
LHDVNGLATTDDPPNLTYVVVNNNGGGIFSLLPQASTVEPTTFERVFGTPHDVDLASLVSAYGVGYVRASSVAELTQELELPPKGLKVVEVRTDRKANATLHERLRQAAAAAVPH